MRNVAKWDASCVGVISKVTNRRDSAFSHRLSFIARRDQQWPPSSVFVVVLSQLSRLLLLMLFWNFDLKRVRIPSLKYTVGIHLTTRP